MKEEQKDFQNLIMEYVDQVKELLSPEIWQNVLLDCSKNELFILWFLFRNQDVSMTQIAEYVHVPLNTATGIISRMQKKKLVLRSHSPQDKRVVTIALAPQGNQQLQSIMKEIMYYVQNIFESLTSEESQMLFQIMGKVMDVLKKKPEPKQETTAKKVRKITIE